MGFFDEFVRDIRAISSEINATKKAVSSSFTELAQDVTGLKKDVHKTIETMRVDTHETVKEIKHSLDVTAKLPQGTDAPDVTNKEDTAA